MLHPHRVSHLMLEQACESAKGETGGRSHRDDDGSPFSLLCSQTRATSRTRRSRYHDDVPQPTNAQGPQSPEEEPPEILSVITRRVRESETHFLRLLTNCPFLFRLRPLAARFLAWCWYCEDLLQSAFV